MNSVYYPVTREQNNRFVLCAIFSFHTFYVLNIRGEGGVQVIGAHLQHSRNCREARQREEKQETAIKQSK